MSAGTIHAGCIAIGGRGVLIAGPSGSGKSDLALRLIDRGATLVSDDYTILCLRGDRLYGAPPETIAGRMEVRGVGIMETPHAAEAPLCLHVELGEEPERLPEPHSVVIAGLPLPSLHLAGLEASAPIKLEAALRMFGLPLP